MNSSCLLMHCRSVHIFLPILPGSSLVQIILYSSRVGCSLMVPYRPGQSEALGKFPNHGELHTVCAGMLSAASQLRSNTGMALFALCTLEAISPVYCTISESSNN